MKMCTCTVICPVCRTTNGVIGLTCLDTKRTVWTYCTSTGKPVVGIDLWNGHHVVRYGCAGAGCVQPLVYGRPGGT